MKTSLPLLVSLLMASTCTFAQTTKVIDLGSSKAGKLSEELTPTEKESITDLTLTGEMNAVDFKLLRDEMPELKTLDLSKVIIQAYEGTEGTFIDLWAEDPNLAVSHAYPANSFPYTAFYQGAKSLEQLHFPTSITLIEDLAFMSQASIKKIDLSACTLLTSIGYLAFARAGEITGVALPNSINSFRGYCFDSLEKMTSFTCMVTDPASMEGVNGLFGLIPTEEKDEEGNPIYANSMLPNCTLYVPESALKAYQEAEVWKNFGKIEAIKGNKINAVKKQLLHIENVGNGQLSIVSEAEQTVQIYSTNGTHILSIKVKAGTTSVSLPQNNVYLINGIKVIL